MTTIYRPERKGRKRRNGERRRKSGKKTRKRRAARSINHQVAILKNTMNVIMIIPIRVQAEAILTRGAKSGRRDNGLL